MPSAVSTPTYQAVNANIANDGSADSPRGYAISTNADLAMSIANTRVYVTATSANRTVTLPTTSVKAGMVVEVQTACTSPYTITIKSSDLVATIDTLKGTKGSIKLMALINTPVAAADWRVMEVYDEGTWVPTITASSGTITSYTLNDARYTRIGRIAHAIIDMTITNKGTGAGELLITSPIAIAKQSAGCVSEIATSGLKGGAYALTAGTIRVTRYDGATMIVDNYRLIILISYEV